MPTPIYPPVRARVRKIMAGTRVPYRNSYINFTPSMKERIGKTVLLQRHVYTSQNVLEPGWYQEPETGFYYHESWLDFLPDTIITDDKDGEENDY